MTLAATDLASGVQLWDLGGGRALGAVGAGSQPHALDPCFSPDGTLLAFGTPDGEVIIWDRAGGRQRARVRVAPQDSLAIAFAPDSQSLAVCGELGRDDHRPRHVHRPPALESRSRAWSDDRPGILTRRQDHRREP